MRLNRRGLLKGFSLGAGASLLAPFLGRLEARAAGNSSTPKRVVFVLQSNGFHPWEAQPVGLARGEDRMGDRPLVSLELPAGLKPLAPFQDRVTILQRLNGRHTFPSHSARFAALGGTARAWQAPLAETVDGALARVLPAPLPILNLGVSINDRVRTPDGRLACCSAWGPKKPIATQMRPELAWKALFGSVAEAAQGDAKALDAAAADIHQVRQGLGSDDRQALDLYLDTFDAADKSQRLARKPSPNQPKVVRDDRFATELQSTQLEAQFDLAAAALIGGLTNVVTLVSGGCDVNGTFGGLGVNFDVHPIGHFQSTENNKSWQDLYTIIRRYHAQLIANLAKKLDAIPEGDGSMLDNTVIVYTSDGADTHHSRGHEWPFVLLGNLGGTLRGGRFVEYATSRDRGNRTINALYCTLLAAAGAPRDHFNLEGATREVDRHGPLEELLAG